MKQPDSPVTNGRHTHRAPGPNHDRRMRLLAILSIGVLLIGFVALWLSGSFGDQYRPFGTVSGDGLHPVFDGTAFAARGPIRIEGKAISEAEILRMIDRSKAQWLASLEQESANQGAHEIVIAKSGYSLLTYESHLVMRDIIWLPVFLDGKLAASVTAFRDGGEVSGSLAWGSSDAGSYFERFDAALAAHPGEKLVFVFAGRNTECLITPDNQIITLNGNPPELKNETDWHRLFMTGHNIISTEAFKDPSHFIVLKSN